ncbi:MAG: cytochrome C oxidase subunit IV family protein [Planctomycetota bacterium]
MATPSQPTTNAAEHAYDPADPHGFHEGDHDHGHVIVPWQTLTGVLLLLFVFTGLTVLQARVEIFADYVWGWEIPRWVNIVLAMSIATIKGTLVVLYFMQLRYDKGLSGILFLFTIFAVWLFLMFTMIDLNGRSTINEWRGGEIVDGGSGVGIRREGFAGAGAIVDVVRENYKAENELSEAEYAKKAAAKHGHYDDTENSMNHSRVDTGLTPGLFDTGPWADSHNAKDDHGDGH